jgi:hypothetical protein
VQSKFHTCSRSNAIALAALCWSAARADEAIVFNPKTYMIEGRLVLHPTPDMVVWDGGGAYRAGEVWVGNGWREYPGGQGALTARMVQPDPAPRVSQRRNLIDTSNCDAALLMWRNY